MNDLDFVPIQAGNELIGQQLLRRKNVIKTIATYHIFIFIEVANVVSKVSSYSYVNT